MLFKLSIIRGNDIKRCNRPAQRRNDRHVFRSWIGNPLLMDMNSLASSIQRYSFILMFIINTVFLIRFL